MLMAYAKNQYAFNTLSKQHFKISIISLVVLIL